MNKKLITGLIACGVLVGTATGATLRYRSSGDCGVITDGTSEGWGVNPNNSGAAQRVDVKASNMTAAV